MSSRFEQIHGVGDPRAVQAGSLGDQLRTLRFLAPYLWPQGNLGFRGRVVAAILALIGAKLVTVSVPLALGGAVDVLSQVSDGGLASGAVMAAVPVALIIAYGLGRVGMMALQQIRDALFARVGQHAQRTIAVNVFRHLHNLSLRYHLERRTGGLSRVIERGIKSIDFLLRFLIFSIFPTFLELGLVCTILVIRYGWSYAVVTFVAVIGYVWFTFSVTEWRVKIRREMNRSDTDANTKAVDSLLNFETVKYFGNEAYETSRYDRAMEDYQDAAIRSQLSLSAINAGQALIFNIGLITLMVMAGFDVAAGRMGAGDFVAVNAFLIQLYMPLNMLGFVYREIKQALVDMESMFQLLDVEPEIQDKVSAPEIVVKGGEVIFDHVDFRYESDRGILQDISFHVPAGKTLAIVGPTGAGKSTISRVLYRFYDIEKGSVRIDGQDIRDVTQESLRASIGIVPQDTVLFNDTIRYNIGYANPGAGQTEIEEAAKLAQIHEFIISLPKGYDTMVGERGLKLSGGEKQRVAIARTILKNPPILLLDEATSALDTKTESEIQAALRQVARNRTTLVIAHRLSTVVDADEIIVLQAGHIAEQGSHGALLAKKGIYADMWSQQREDAEKSDGAEAQSLEDREPSPLTSG